MEWLRQLVGLPPTFSGVIQDTASTATLVALLCARAHHRPRPGTRRAAGNPRLTVYASEMAHSSVEKAALLAGLGRDNLRLLPTDDAHALRPDALEEALRTDVEAGRRPCAIVATVGSTGTTAIDPLARIGEIARAHGAWLHVDAAMAGTAMVRPELRWMWEGVEQADSVVWNPHKWLGIGFDCTAYHVRDPDHLGAGHGHRPELPPHRAGRRGEELPRLGHRPRPPLPFPQGVVRPLRTRRGGHPRRGPPPPRARPLARGADRRHARLGAARARPPADGRLPPQPFGPGSGRARRAQPALARAINASRKAYLTPAVVKGAQILRVSIGATGTTAGDVTALWARLRDTAATLAARH